MINFPLPRIDKDKRLARLLLPHCRFKPGDIWEDPLGKHRIGCLDAADKKSIKKLMGDDKADIAIHDPPYNLIAFGKKKIENFISWTGKWINNTEEFSKKDSSLYLWLGADQFNNFQPFAEIILFMKETGYKSRSFITMRNQRGFGTQKNWMAVRQELLYYVKGDPYFNVKAEYTDIPKVLNGYYKKVNGKITANFERSKSEFIRAGNVWIDIQQVFYRMEENVNGCYAQKPLKAIERIINSSSRKDDLIIDYFSHSGTVLLASEMLERKCYTTDLDPVYCEISLRRLEHYRKMGKKGWQNSNPFQEEIGIDKKLLNYLRKNYGLSIQDSEIIVKVF